MQHPSPPRAAAPPLRRPPHSLSPSEAAGLLQTDLTSGLAPEEARSRVLRYGRNVLEERGGPTRWQTLARQFTDFLILLLLGAGVVSAALGEFADASLILAIVVLNGALGFVQEWRAEQALQALKRLAAPTARVIRGGLAQEVSSSELVPGDLVLLEAGNYVPADLRLAEAFNLKLDEASLTGESTPVEKKPGTPLPEDTPVADRVNCALMGTVAVYGRGTGLVTATGMQAEIGKIAKALQEIGERETPLQRRLAQVGRWLGGGALAICVLVFVIGLLQGKETLTMFLVSVSLAVAAVPEGLPAVVTIVLAIGLTRMAARHALVRRLPAVETLGSATVICSDKTGTLTRGEMMVVRLYGDGRSWQVTGQGYEPRGEFVVDRTEIGGSTQLPQRLLMGAALCTDASLDFRSDEESRGTGWHLLGDPTEGALVALAGKAGLDKRELERQHPRLAEVPFSSERKRMTTVHAGGDDASPVAFMKGAADVVLELCRFTLEDGRRRELTPEDRERIARVNEEMAANALRVLAVAERPLDTLPPPHLLEKAEDEFTFLGLVGMIDPPRTEAMEAVRRCHRAGVRVVMITGDHKTTAMAIAKALHIADDTSLAFTGREVDAVTDEQLNRLIGQTAVFARVSPQHKVRVVETLRHQGHIVAVTGDGVNDALALTRAHIGIAMGITGTDVAKGASDMILTDDDFASIVAAVEEGRLIYDNIRKFVFYLLSANLGEVLVVLASVVAGLPLPLRAVQILWINLLTDSFPALALGMEPGRPEMMKAPPRPPREPVITRQMAGGLAVQGVLMGVAGLTAFFLGYRGDDGTLGLGQTMAFTTLIIDEVLRAHTCRSLRLSVFGIGLFRNRAMWGATALALLLLGVVLYVPALQDLFHTEPLGAQHWGMVLPLALLPPLGYEVTKAFTRRAKPSPRPSP